MPLTSAAANGVTVVRQRTTAATAVVKALAKAAVAETMAVEAETPFRLKKR